jgi:hypothetical protein
VSSSDYPSDGNEHGQVGQTGTFTFSPPATHPEDVAAYVYALNGNKVSEGSTVVAAADHTATVKVTPYGSSDTRDGYFLNVWAKDKAGNVSATSANYTFLVAPGQGPVGWWKLDDGTGSTAADSSATGSFPGALSSSGATWESHPGYSNALHLDGSSGQVTTAPGVLSTDQSYTVAAWVQLVNLNNYATVVSVEGTTQSGFFLQYNKSFNRWVFIMPASETGSTYYESVSATVPTPGVWTHLAGVYDAATASLTLYVNGVAQPSASIPTPWKVSGKLHIGAALTPSGVVNFVNGDIDDVRAYNRALTPAEARDLAGAPALVGAWDLAEGAGATAADSSGVTPPHDVALGEGESWTTLLAGNPTPNPNNHYPLTGEAVNFDPAAQTCLTTTGPVLRTDQSFTVAAWVRVDDLSDYRTAVSQAGGAFSTPFLQYSKSFNRWAFVLPTASDPAYTQSTAASTDPPTPGRWTHLVGVYDVGAATMDLYVDGAKEGHVDNVPPSWNSTGALRIGCAYDGTTNYNYWSGDIAEVRIYQGVADQALVTALEAG